MNFLKQYINFINYALMGLAFGFASFYLLANAYHYLEIRKDFVDDFDSQPLITNIQEKINRVRTNISSFNANTYNGKVPTSKMIVISSNLNTCVNSFNNDTMQSMRGKQKLSIIDVYNLRESYENDILSDCIVNSLYWTTSLTDDNFNSKYLINNSNMMKLYVNTLLNSTSYLKKDLINNSSYFFNTSIASASIKNNTKDGFYEVIDAYNKAADFVEFVSNWFNNEVNGNYE